MHDHIVQRLTAVINTLNAATVRADQIDAVQRINACTNELRSLIETIEDTEKAKTDGRE